MRKAHFLAVVLLTFAIAACDTTAFTEDFPDPGTEGLPPYVAFTSGSVASANNWTHDRNQPDRGSVRVLAVPTAEQNLNFVARLPTALGEDVTVTYAVRGNAVEGQDYRITVQAEPVWVVPGADADPEEVPTWVYDDTAYVTPANNQFAITYRIEDSENYFRRFRITILPTATAGRELQVELVSASAPSGRTITTGRLPANQDRIVTVVLQ